MNRNKDDVTAPRVEREADDGAGLNVDGVNRKVGESGQVGKLYELETKLATCAKTFASHSYCPVASLVQRAGPTISQPISRRIIMTTVVLTYSTEIGMVLSEAKARFMELYLSS